MHLGKEYLDIFFNKNISFILYIKYKVNIYFILSFSNHF